MRIMSRAVRFSSLSSAAQSQSGWPVCALRPLLTWQKPHCTPSEAEMKFISAPSCDCGRSLSTCMFLPVCPAVFSAACGPCAEVRAALPQSPAKAAMARPAHTTPRIKRSFDIGSSIPFTNGWVFGCPAGRLRPVRALYVRRRTASTTFINSSATFRTGPRVRQASVGRFRRPAPPEEGETMHQPRRHATLLALALLAFAAPAALAQEAPKQEDNYVTQKMFQNRVFDVRNRDPLSLEIGRASCRERV